MTSLYIHIPFCEKKCFYCSFVVSIGQEHRIDEYLNCLAQEADAYRGTKIETIYLGGGTPTFLNAGQLDRLMKIIREYFRFDSSVEWTIEANPEGLDFAKAQALFDSGCNRVSLGVQSLNDKYLKYLGRCHDRGVAIQAFNHLRRAGFNHINLDLMYGFPGQTKEELMEDVRAVCAIGSDHLSLYTLTIEENSRFFTRQVQLPSTDIQADYYVLVKEFMEKAGFQQYEISNFAKPGKKSQHNLNYWRGGNYIGLGVGAHSHQEGKRFWNGPKLIEHIKKLKQGLPSADGSEELPNKKRLMETILFGLRMNEGVDLEEVQARFGLSIDADCQDRIRRFVDQGFLIREQERLKASAKGQLVLDEICSNLI